MSNPENSGDNRRDTRFQSGQSGNPAGKPKGSRNKLGEEFLASLYADFQVHGMATIERVRMEKPDAYLKVVASLLPREVKLSASIEDLTDEQLNLRIRQLAAGLGLVLAEDGDDDQPVH